jgi:hypothetical protein
MMNYINRFKLINKLLQKKKLDYRELLSSVDRNAVIKALKRTKEGVPKSFRYTDEPMEEENLSKMPQKKKEQLWKLYADIREYPEKVLPKLLELQERYPQVPCIYNYIASAYAYLGHDRQYLEMLIETKERFPDYLFGKISLAEYHVNHNHHRKVPSILDYKLEIYQHYPVDVDIFHISEVRSFYGVVGRYFVRSNKIARALFCYFALEGIDIENWNTRLLGEEIIKKEVEKLRKDFSKNVPKKTISKKKKR